MENQEQPMDENELIMQQIRSRFDPKNEQYIARQEQMRLKEDERKAESADLKSKAQISEILGAIGSGADTAAGYKTDTYKNFRNDAQSLRDQALALSQQGSQEQSAQKSEEDKALFNYLTQARDERRHRESVDAMGQRNQEQKRQFDQKMRLESRKAEDASKKVAQPKPPSGDQFKAAGFAKRIEQAEDVFNKLGDEGYNRAGVEETIKSKIPGFASNFGIDLSQSQMQDQAERNFVNSVLRRESGAAISASEFDSAEKQYFPRSGDSADVAAQKRANRQQVLESLKAESSGAYDKVQSVPSVAAGRRSSYGEALGADMPKSEFPRQVRNPQTGESATVNSNEELQEANKEGFQ